MINWLLERASVTVEEMCSIHKLISLIEPEFDRNWVQFFIHLELAIFL